MSKNFECGFYAEIREQSALSFPLYRARLNINHLARSEVAVRANFRFRGFMEMRLQKRLVVVACALLLPPSRVYSPLLASFCKVYLTLLCHAARKKMPTRRIFRSRRAARR